MEILRLSSASALLSECESAIVFGAGSVGRSVVRLLRNKGLSVPGILDRRARPGELFDGIPVLAPDSEAARRALAAKGAVAIIAVFNRGADPAEIGQTLAQAGCQRVVTFYQIYDLFPDELGWRFWLAPRRDLEPHAKRIDWLRTVLQDARSVETLDALIAQRRTQSLEFPRPEPSETQYLPPEIHGLSEPAVLAHFVDCGAFDGDTLARLAPRFPPAARASCFEPDPANFAKLAERLRTGLGGGLHHVSLWPCGVWDSTTQLRFISGQGEGSRIAAGGDTLIQAVALDDALVASPPVTFIKLDIEGAEPEALLGASRTITRDRPVLAASAYHKPTHLWQLADLVSGWDLGYEFYLRVYAHQGFETVLYAIPRGA